MVRFLEGEKAVDLLTEGYGYLKWQTNSGVLFALIQALVALIA
jgi:hypothetical protein